MRWLRKAGRRPLVSVIVPCFNQGHLLLQSVGSVLAQSVTDIECLVIDDGSEDKTPTVAKSMERLDRRVSYHLQDHEGLSAARNLGIEIARGKYFQFLDSDDTLDPTKLQRQLDAVSPVRDPVIATCDYRRVSRDLVTPEKEWYVSPRISGSRPILDFASRWETELTIPPHCFLFDRRLFDNGPVRFDSSLANHEDWDCWMTLLKTDPILIQLDQVLVTYFVGLGTMSRQAKRMRSGFLAAIEKQLSLARNSDQELFDVLRTKSSITEEYYDQRLSND